MAQADDDDIFRRQLRLQRAWLVIEAERARLTREYEEQIVNPWDAADRGYVDAVIDPSATRAEITRALRLLRTKRATLPAKKHGNIPL